MLIKTKNISWGESFSDILSKNQIDNGVIFKAIQKSKTIFNLKQLKKGKNYTLLFDLNNPKPSYFIYEPDVYTALIYYLGDSVFVKEHKKPIMLKEKVAVGNIESSLYETIVKNKLPIDLVYLLIDVFAWQVDFYKVQKGDKFKVYYVEETIDDKLIGIKEVKAAYFYHKNEYNRFDLPIVLINFQI